MDDKKIRAKGLMLCCYPKEEVEIKRAARANNFRTPMDLLREVLRQSKLVKGATFEKPRKVEGII